MSRASIALTLLALTAHAQTFECTLVMDEGFRSAEVTTLRSDGGVIWRGTASRGETSVLAGSASDASYLQLEWERIDGGRGTQVEAIPPNTIPYRVLAHFRDEPTFGFSTIVPAPRTLQFSFKDCDDSSGLGTAVIDNRSDRYGSAPEVMLERFVDGGWVPAVPFCGQSQHTNVPAKTSTTLSIASSNCVSQPLTPGRYRRVVTMDLFPLEKRRVVHFETVRFEREFTAKQSFRTPVALGDLPLSQINRPWHPNAQHVYGPDRGMVCACEGLVIGRERGALTWERGELLVRPLDGGVPRDLLNGGRKIGDFPTTRTKDFE